MKPKLSRLLLALMVMGQVLTLPAFALAQDPHPTLQKSMAWLHKLQAGFSSEAKKNVPAVEAILERYFNDPSSLRASEEEIATAFFATMPSGSDLGSRGAPLDKMKEFESLVSSPKASTKPVSHGSHHPVTRVVKHSVPGIHFRPTFRAARISAPGGKAIGSVSISAGGHSKTVVEVLSASPNLDVYRRAQIVASRMQRLSSGNPLWWTMLHVSQVHGQYVVGTSRSSDFVITADDAFAKEWGVTPQVLAGQLVTKIRSAIDSEKSDTFGGRDLTTEEMHIAAVDLRQQGDFLYRLSPRQAEDKYKAAIANDPTYSVPYLRLAEIYLAKRDRAGAKAILEKGAAVGEMSPTQRADIQRKLASLH